MAGSITKDLHEIVGNAQGIGRLVLRQEVDVAAALSADLVDEFVEGGGVGEIDVRVGFGTVAVAAADEGNLEAGGKLDDGIVFLPRAKAVEFKGMDVTVKLGDELFGHCAVGGSADAGFIPERMIEDEEGIGELAEPGHQFGGAVSIGQNFMGAGMRKIVDAEVDDGAIISGSSISCVPSRLNKKSGLTEAAASS